MADILSSFFGSKTQVPKAVTVNAADEANKAANYNISQANQFGSYAGNLTKYMKDLFNQTVNPQANQAENTYYNNANQLATTGTTSAVQNYQQYARRLGLEQASSTGAPISSQYGQSLGGSFSIEKILQNQLQGSSMLNQYGQQQNQLAQSFMQPALQTYSANLSSPGQFISTALSNAQMQNQMGLTAATANAQANPFGGFLANAGATVGGSILGGTTGGLGSSLGNQIFKTIFS